MTKIFISYARADGEVLANEIRARLSEDAPKVSVWRDRERMEGGKGWWLQITEAIDAVEVLVLVMTPCSMTSETVRREWRYARKQGVTIYPIGADFATLPEFHALPNWMRKAHMFDVDREWKAFVNYLNSPIKSPRVPFMVPDLPSNFVPRPDLSEPLVEALIGNGGTNVAIRTKLTGAGGLGKTTLAQAVASHDDVVEVFEDGILWVTLGNDAKLLNECARLYVALTGDRPSFIDVDDAAFHLGEILQQRNCLLVIDDVWHRSDLEPFQRSLRGGAALITTRIPGLAEDFKTVHIGTMNAENGLTLLCRKLDADETVMHALIELRDALSGWPLLLELANAQLLRRLRIGDQLLGAINYIVERFRAKGVVAFDMRDARNRNDALALSVEISLDMAGSEAADALLLVGICPEDTAIPLRILQVLWGTDAFDTEDLAAALHDFSLVTLDISTDTIMVHDVIRSYAVSKLGNAALRQLHFADSLVSSGMANSAYALRWLPYHLLEAQAFDRLEALFTDLGWLTTCLTETNFETVLDLLGLMPTNKAVSLVSEAVALTGALVGSDTSQIAGQVLGRCGSLAMEKSDLSNPWIEPLDPLLRQAGGPLVGRVQASKETGVRDIAWSSSGALVALDQAGIVSTWTVEQSRALATCDTHARFSKRFLYADAQAMLLTGGGGQIWRYDLENNTLSETVFKHDPFLADVFLSEPENGIAINRWGALLTWPLDGYPRYRFGNLPAITHLVWAKHHVYAGALSGMVFVLDAQTDDVVVELAAHQTEVTAITVSENGQAFSMAVDGSIAVWSSLEPKKGCKPLAKVPGACRIACANGLVAVGTSEGQIVVLDDQSGAVIITLSAHQGPVTALSFAPEGGHLVSAGCDGLICRWDLNRPEQTPPPVAHNGPVRAVLQPLYNQIFSISDVNELMLLGKPVGEGPGFWAIDSQLGMGHAILHLPGSQLIAVPGNPHVEMNASRPYALQLTQKNDVVLTIDAEQEVMLWDSAQRKCLLSVSLDPNTVESAAISSSFSRLTVADWSGTSRSYDLLTGATSTLPIEPMCRLALNGDGTILVGATTENHIRIVAPNHRHLWVPGGAPIAALAVCPKGHHIALCQDNHISIWTLDGQRIAQFTAEEEIVACAMGPRPSDIVIGTAGGKVVRCTLHLAGVADAE